MRRKTLLKIAEEGNPNVGSMSRYASIGELKSREYAKVCLDRKFCVINTYTFVGDMMLDLSKVINLKWNCLDLKKCRL